MGSASPLLFVVGLSLVNVALMDPTEEALDFLDDLGNEQAELTLAADGSGASSSQTRQMSVAFAKDLIELKVPAIAICKKLNHLEILGITATGNNVARAVGCSKLADLMKIDVTEGVMDAFTFVQAVGETDIRGGTANDEQCSSRNTRKFVNGYQGKKFYNSIKLRRSVYDVCQTVHEATAVIPITDENGFRHRGCICASKHSYALTSSTVDIYMIPITDLVVYDYLEGVGHMIAAGIGHANIINSYNGDQWMQMALSRAAFQTVCLKLTSEGQREGKRHQARLTACFAPQ